MHIALVGREGLSVLPRARRKSLRRYSIPTVFGRGSGTKCGTESSITSGSVSHSQEDAFTMRRSRIGTGRASKPA
jgi:hypothetical protein